MEELLIFDAYLLENHSLVEKQQSFIRFYMLPNTFWRILDGSYKIFHA